MPLVFISYAHAEPAEAELARLIAERLRRDGAELFFDERLRTGQDWNEAIEQALDACDAFCALLSATSLASPMVQNEIARVGERRRRHGTPAVWPIRCRHDGRLPYDIGAHLRRIQYLTWQGEADTAFTLDELLDRWRELRDGPQPEPPPPALCTLPGRIADFTGREPEIADLIAALCREDRRAAVSAIGGMGGAGKTTLAIEAAWRMAGRFPDGILYVDMLGFGTAPSLTPAQAIAAVIEQLEPTARLPDRLDQLLPLYRRLLAGRKLLLLLDNARETIQAADLVPPPPVALLVTSRHRIFIDGATHLNLDVMPAEEARGLLRRIVDDRRATDAEVDTLAQYCSRLPLALRAAGTFLTFRPGLKATDYLDLLAIEHLRLDYLRVPRANRDLRATLALSASVLEADDPDLALRWRELTVFPSTFRVDAAAAIWGWDDLPTSDSLDQLVSRSLLYFEHETSRYRLHDLIRAVAAEKLEWTAQQKASARHADYYCSLLTKIENMYSLGDSNIGSAIFLLDEERINIKVGQEWSANFMQDNVHAARLAIAYARQGVTIQHFRQRPSERLAWLKAGIAAARASSDRDSEANLLWEQGVALKRLHKPREAIYSYEQSLCIAREIDDRELEAYILANLGNAWVALSEPYTAIQLLDNAVRLSREMTNEWLESGILTNMGTAYRDLGQVDMAQELFEKAHKVAQMCSNKKVEITALAHLGILARRRAEYDKAAEYIDGSIVIAQTVGDQTNECIMLRHLADVWADWGETRKSISVRRRGLAIARAIGEQREEGDALWNLALAYDSVGDMSDAVQCARESLASYRLTEDPLAQSVEEWLRARCLDPDG